MAVSNKTIIALALLAIAVAVVAESQGTMRPECVVGVRGVQCGAQLSLCVCVRGDHPSYPLSSLSGTRGRAARSLCAARVATTRPHITASHTHSNRVSTCVMVYGVCLVCWWCVQLLTSSRRLRRWLRPTVSWPR